MRRFLLLLFVVFISITAFAQIEVKEGSFKEVPGFVNINPDENYQTDDNNLPFAVVKVRTENINEKQRRELKFSGNGGTFIMLEYKDGEVWVYLTAKYADYLKISHPDLSSVEFVFPYDLEPKKGYEMTLVKRIALDEDILERLERLEALQKAEISQSKPEEINNSGFINGKFSVSPNKQVYFSKGNLQYQASTNTWRFAEHQWNFIGKPNKNMSSSYSGWIDLFGWGTSGYNGKNPWMTSRNPKDYGEGKMDIAGTNYDWGVYNTISNGGDKHWRTLTKDEWEYLINIRTTNCNIRYAKAIVNGVNGLILLPDDWNNDIFRLNETDKDNARYRNCSIISQSDWQSLFEANGAVFLPEAGQLDKSMECWTSGADYWSTSTNGVRTAITFGFSEFGVYVYGGIYRWGNNSVRLVCDVEE